MAYKYLNKTKILHHNAVVCNLLFLSADPFLILNIFSAPPPPILWQAMWGISWAETGALYIPAAMLASIELSTESSEAYGPACPPAHA